MSMVALRMPDELRIAVEDAAKRSGWSLSEQIRYELAERRGMVHKPYLPTRPTEEAPSDGKGHS